MFNIFPASSTIFMAASATYPYDDVQSLISNYYELSSGYKIVNNKIISPFIDVAQNRDTVFYISSAMDIATFFNSYENILTPFIYTFYAGIQTDNGYYYQSTDDELYANVFGITDDGFFEIQTNGVILYIIKDGKYATVDRTAPWNITFQDRLINDVNQTQSFEFFKSGNNIFINTRFKSPYPYGPDIIKQFLYYDINTYQVRATGVGVDNYKLKFYSPQPGDLKIGYAHNIHWVNYYNEFLGQNNKNLTINNNITGIRQNYLIDLAYKTKLQNQNGIINADINIANLKNIQTPEYEYSLSPNIQNNLIVSGANPNQRDYKKIFLGTNQEDGYNKPFLEYSANTKEVLLQKDNLTYFHYPISAPSGTNISIMGFIEAGATPGSSPVRSDKVFKKMANYKKNIFWGDSQQSQTGVWLCSWLSGAENNTNTPIWKDRWYDPGYITIVGASTSTQTQYNENSGIVLWDEDSSMTFDPGVWYAYHHIGENDNLSIVKSLTGDGNNLALYKQGPYNLNGSSIVEIPYDTSYRGLSSFSFATWVGANNWSNVKGHQIIGNYFRGGWGINWTNGFFSAIIPVYDSHYGHIIFSNIEGNSYYDRLAPKIGSSFATPNNIAVDSELFVWATDNNYKKLYKIDYTSDILIQVDLPTTSNIESLVIDRDNNVYVLDTFNDTISSFNKLGTYQNNIAAAGASILKFDSNNTLLKYNYDDVSLTTSNSSVYINNGELYYESLLLYDQNVTNVAVDSEDNIWALFDETKYIKFDVNGAFVLSGQNTSMTSTSLTSRNISFTNEYTTNGRKNFTWIVQGSDQTLYKLDDTGVIVDYINLTDKIDVDNYLDHDKGIMSFAAKGDFTGYDWQRTFKYDGNEYIEAKLLFGDNQLNTSAVSLQYNISNLNNNDDYHFAITYNEGNVVFYVNSVNVGTYTLPSDAIIFNLYQTSILIGSDNTNISSLDGGIKTNTFNFIGDVNDVRIYNLELNNSDIGHIFRLNTDFDDMKWNMPIGKKYFIEEIERFFKHKLPGSKSQFYNVKITGLSSMNSETKELIEEIIRDNTKKLTPAYSILHKIIWE